MYERDEAGELLSKKAFQEKMELIRKNYEYFQTKGMLNEITEKCGRFRGKYMSLVNEACKIGSKFVREEVSSYVLIPNNEQGQQCANLFVTLLTKRKKDIANEIFKGDFPAVQRICGEIREEWLPYFLEYCCQKAS